MTNKKYKSIFQRDVNPFKQTGIVIGLVVFLQLGIKFCDYVLKWEIDPMNYWIVSATFLLFFTLVNSVLSLSSRNKMSYYSRSVFSFAIMAFGSGILATVFSGISLNEAGSFRWIFMVLTIIFIVFLTIVNLMRTIVELAKRQDKKIRNEE